MANIPDDKLDQLTGDITEIKTLLKGYNGFPGLCKSHEDLTKDYYSFKRWVVSIVSFMVGAGILTGGVIGIINSIGG
jgi:hypothetical protein